MRVEFPPGLPVCTYIGWACRNHARHSIAEGDMKVCSKCGFEKYEREDFYKRTDRPCSMSWCKVCLNEYRALRNRLTKEKAISFMGGHCSHCGYSKCSAALEFHHVDRNKKSLNFTSARCWNWSRLLEELKNCILLCANCHREEEERISEGC